MGGWNGKTPFAGARPPKGKFDDWDSRTKFIVPLLEVLRASPSPVVFVFIAGLKGLGKSSIVDFATYIYKGDLENARSCIQWVFDLGKESDSDEIKKVKKEIEQLDDDTPIVVCLNVNNNSYLRCVLSKLVSIYRKLDRNVDASAKTKVIWAIERSEPYPYCIDNRVGPPEIGGERRTRAPQLCDDVKIDKSEVQTYGWTGEWGEEKEIQYCVVNIQDDNVKNAPLLYYSSPVYPLPQQEIDRWIYGEDGHIIISENYWKSEPHKRYCRREEGYSPEPIRSWGGRHPLLLSSAVGELCKYCHDGGARCNDKLLEGIEEVDDDVSRFLGDIREDIRRGGKKLKIILNRFGLLTRDNRVVGAVGGDSPDPQHDPNAEPWLEVILELVYWKWYIEKDMKHVRLDFRQEVVDLVEEIGAGRWFPQQPPLKNDGQLDIRESTRRRLLQKAQERYHRQPLSEEGQKAIKKKLVAWLEYYELEVVIQRCERCVGNSHRDISDAETLVESIDVSKLAQLVVTMYDVELMLSELRDLLNRLDDVEVEQLFIVPFHRVADKLGDGMGKQGKINVLLDYCRRYPQEGERLRRILLSENQDTGGRMMDEALVLSAGLQFAYWFWNAIAQPGVTRFSERIGATLGDIASEKLYDLFGKEPPRDAQGQVDESETRQQELIKDALSRIRRDPAWNSEHFMNTTKRVLVQLLRDPTKYSMEELQEFWLSCGDPKKEFRILVAQYSMVGDLQASIADRLVMESIRRGTLPKLIEAMRRKKEDNQ